MLVQDSSILKLVKFAMSMFDSHVLQEVGTFLSWETCNNANDRMSPFIDHGDTTRTHAYLDTAISI